MPHRSPPYTNSEIHPVARKGAQWEGKRLLWKARRRVAAYLIGGLMMTAAPVRALGQPPDPLVSALLESMRSGEAAAGSILSHAPLMGALNAGESASFEVHACSGIQYTVQGICDFGCTDFDLTAYDSSAQVLDSDVLSDDVPVLIFTPAESGIMTLSVEMVSCTGSCDWGVQLFIDDGTGPGPPGSGDGGASTWPSDWGPYLGTYRGPGGETIILRHENRLVVLFPLSQQQNGATDVLRPTGSTHVFRLESSGSSADGDRVRFAVNDAGEATAVFVAGRESRRVGW